MRPVYFGSTTHADRDNTIHQTISCTPVSGKRGACRWKKTVLMLARHPHRLQDTQRVSRMQVDTACVLLEEAHKSCAYGRQEKYVKESSRWSGSWRGSVSGFIQITGERARTCKQTHRGLREAGIASGRWWSAATVWIERRQGEANSHEKTARSETAGRPRRRSESHRCAK